MDAVSVERLIQRFRDNGELENEDPALLLLNSGQSVKSTKKTLKNLQAWNRRYMYIGYN